MTDAPSGGERRVIPVSPADVARVVSGALAERSRVRIRLTSGQRRAILNRRLRPGAAQA